MIAYAKANECEAELGKALLYLLSVVTGSMIERDPHDIDFKFTEKEVNQRVEITSDWAPQSLNFAIFNDKEKCVFHGGFIHRGPRQGEVPRVGDTVQLQIGVMAIAAYEFWNVERIDYFQGKQGLAFTLRHPSGVYTVIDRTDLLDGAYPFVMTIHTLVISHEYGASVFTFVSEAEAQARLFAWVKEYWELERFDEPIPEDPDEAIAYYFEHLEKEYAEIHRNFI